MAKTGDEVTLRLKPRAGKARRGAGADGASAGTIEQASERQVTAKRDATHGARANEARGKYAKRGEFSGARVVKTALPLPK